MSNNKLTPLLEYQVPSYVHGNYDLFTEFITAYYKWLEEDGNILMFLQDFEENINIDLSNDDFVAQFLNEFVELLPPEKELDDRTLIKVIREYYLAKGAEDSFKFLFRVLYNSGVDIIHPREFLFKTSDNIWSGDIFIKTTAVLYSQLDLSNKDITILLKGNSSGSTAVVDRMEKRIVHGAEYIEFELSSYDGDFLVGESIDITVNNQTITEKVLGSIIGFDVIDGEKDYVLNGIVSIVDTNGVGQSFYGVVDKTTSGELHNYTINSAGTGYQVGEFVYATPIDANVNGFGFVGEIVRVGDNGEILNIEIVDTGRLFSAKTKARIDSKNGVGGDIDLWGENIGSLQNIKILDSGFNFKPDDILEVYVDGILRTGVKPIVGSVFHAPKNFKTEKGFSSHNLRLIDSFYYQQFSYVLKTFAAPQKWRGIVHRLAHPAGSIMFSMWENLFEMEDEMITGLDNLTSLIKLFNSYVDMLSPTNSGINWAITAKQKINDDVCISGNILSNLDEVKFMSTFTWKIQHFYEYTINDVYKKCQPYLNKLNDSTITISTV